MLWPLVFGLVCCGLGLWGGLVYTHNQTAFSAHAVPAKSVIDQLYAGGSTVNSNGVVSFDQYAIVHFQAGRQTAHARVMLASCAGKCVPGYRIGQELNVFYNPQNLGYAQLTSGISYTGYIVVGFLGFLGITSLAAAIINAVMQRRQVPARVRG